MLGAIRGCIGADKECRYSGARMGIGSIRGIGGFLGVLGPLGISGVYWGLAGSVSTHRPEGV